MAVNRARRRVIEGDDVNAALSAARLGDAPVCEALKNALVGDDKR